MADKKERGKVTLEICSKFKEHPAVQLNGQSGRSESHDYVIIKGPASKNW